jgi:hypothetical protein
LLALFAMQAAPIGSFISVLGCLSDRLRNDTGKISSFAAKNVYPIEKCGKTFVAGLEI